MAKLAFVFPGQGSQYPGMGKELAATFPEAARVFAAGDKICGYALSNLCFEGPSEKLDQTEFAQPAILITSLACLKVAQDQGLNPHMVAGLSLGEYTALAASGSLSLAETLTLIMKRGRLMQAAVPPGAGAMAAVLGMKSSEVEEICASISGIVTVANYNSPGQLVISGEKNAVEEAANILKNQGGKVKILAVSVPSHSPLMEKCSRELGLELENIVFQEPLIPVISNVNARENPTSEFKNLLVQQLFSPVKWEQSVRYMMTQVDYFIEVGPGSSLTGLIKKIDRNRVLGQVENSRSLEKLLKKVEEI